MTAPATFQQSIRAGVYLRPRQVAALTGESLRTVWRRIHDGTYRSERRGRCRLVLAEDVVPQAPRATRPAVTAEVRALRRELGV